MPLFGRRVDERLGVSHHAGIGIDQFHEPLEAFYVVKKLGIVPGDAKELGASLSLLLFELFDHPMLHGLSTPDAIILVARRIALTARTG